MLLPQVYQTANVPPQVTTSQTWWQGLFGLGQEAIRRALPLPGDLRGVPGVPLTPVTAQPQQQGFMLSPTVLIAALVGLVTIFFLRK
ncbi:MAG: hypothetical protein ACREA9_29005 [Pyrinomonadaceae bacterium]